MSRLIIVQSSPVLYASGYDSVRVSTCYHIIERGQNQSFDKNPMRTIKLQTPRTSRERTHATPTRPGCPRDALDLPYSGNDPEPFLFGLRQSDGHRHSRPI